MSKSSKKESVYIFLENSMLSNRVVIGSKPVLSVSDERERQKVIVRE